MSRYTVRVRQADSLHGTFACDSVYVDGGGNLKVNRVQRPGDDLLTVARIQHGHWSSYELEPTSEDNVDTCASGPVTVETLPEVGSIVHVWLESGCLPMRVKAHEAAPVGALLLGRTDRALLLAPVPDWAEYASLTHDETRTESGSWHWPHDDDQDAEPDPQPSAPNLTINVHGSVLSERDLADAIQKQISLYIRKQRAQQGIYRR